MFTISYSSKGERLIVKDDLYKTAIEFSPIDAVTANKLAKIVELSKVEEFQAALLFNELKEHKSYELLSMVVFAVAGHNLRSIFKSVEQPSRPDHSLSVGDEYKSMKEHFQKKERDLALRLSLDNERKRQDDLSGIKEDIEKLKNRGFVAFIKRLLDKRF